MFGGGGADVRKGRGMSFPFTHAEMCCDLSYLVSAPPSEAKVAAATKILSVISLDPLRHRAGPKRSANMHRNCAAVFRMFTLR